MAREQAPPSDSRHHASSEPDLDELAGACRPADVTDSSLNARYRALHRLDSTANRAIRADIWEPGEDVGQQSFITPRYLDELARRISIGPSDHLLDVGSGAGGPALYLAEATGCRVTGIEPNAVGVEVASSLAADAGLGDQLAFDAGTAMEMPYADETFDVAISLNVVNVIEDKVALFREVRRVVRPGGRWALLTGTFELGEADADVRRRLTRDHTVPLFDDTAEGYRAKLVEAGFRIDEISEYISDFRTQIARWAAANRKHADALEAEQGAAAAERHLAYFDTYLELAEAGRAANHLFLATA